MERGLVGMVKCAVDENQPEVIVFIIETYSWLVVCLF